MTGEEPSNPSNAGTVVLDIGGRIGAAVVFTPATFEGREIEIRHIGDPWTGRHTGVRQRRVVTGAVYAGVFPALDEGEYEIRPRDLGRPAPTATFTIIGGRVTLHHLASPMSTAAAGP